MSDEFHELLGVVYQRLQQGTPRTNQSSDRRTSKYQIYLIHLIFLLTRSLQLTLKSSWWNGSTRWTQFSRKVSTTLVLRLGTWASKLISFYN